MVRRRHVASEFRGRSSTPVPKSSGCGTAGAGGPTSATTSIISAANTSVTTTGGEPLFACSAAWGVFETPGCSGVSVVGAGGLAAADSSSSQASGRCSRTGARNGSLLTAGSKCIHWAGSEQPQRWAVTWPGVRTTFPHLVQRQIRRTSRSSLSPGPFTRIDLSEKC